MDYIFFKTAKIAKTQEAPLHWSSW